MPSSLTPAETLRVRKHIKRIEHLSQELTRSTGSIHQKILSEWGQALDHVRGGHRIMAVLSRDAQQVVVHARRALSRDRKHFSDLEQSGWRLPLEKLVDTFGCAALVSHDFVEKLAFLARKAADIVPWDEAWSALSAARSSRQTKSGGAFLRGVDRSREWVPADIDKAAAELGQTPLRASKKAVGKKVDAVDGADEQDPAPDDVPSPERARRSSAPLSERNPLYDETPENGLPSDESSGASPSEDVRSSASATVPLHALDAHQDEWDLPGAGHGTPSLVEDADLFVQSTDSSINARSIANVSVRHLLSRHPSTMEPRDGKAATRNQLATPGLARRLHPGQYPEPCKPPQKRNPEGADVLEVLPPIAAEDLESSPRAKASPGSRHARRHKNSSALSEASHASPRGQSEIARTKLGEVEQQQPRHMSPATDTVSPSDVRLPPNLDDTLKRLSGARDGGWLAHQSFNDIFRAVLPPSLRYLEVPDYSEDPSQRTRWSTWAATTIRNTGCGAYCSVVHVTERKHWVLLFISVVDREVREYDSIRGNDFTLEPAARHVVTRLGGDWEGDKWSYHRPSSPEQQDGSSCGVYATACALFAASGVAIPSALNSNLWRSALQASISNEASSIALPTQQPAQAEGHDLARAEALRELVVEVEVAFSVFQNLLSSSEGSKARMVLDLANQRERIACDEAVLPTLAKNCREDVGTKDCSCDDGLVAEPPEAPMAYAHYQYVVRIRRERRQLLRYQEGADNIDSKLVALARVLRSLKAWKLRAADELSTEEQLLLKARERYEEVERESKRKKEAINEFLARIKRAKR